MIRSFRIHLQETLAERCAANPRYSLRAFARRLGINHSTLSQILRGKRPVSERTIRALGNRMRLDDAAIGVFVEHERRFPANHTMAEIEIQHLILELASRQSFRTDVSWISRVLGVPAASIHIALTQLLAMGLLKMEDRDRWIVIKENKNGKTGDSMANPCKGTRKG